MGKTSRKSKELLKKDKKPKINTKKEKNKKDQKLDITFIIILTILVILIITSIILVFDIINRKKEYDNKKQKYEEKISIKKKELKDIHQEYDLYLNLDQAIEAKKEEYFQLLKQLEEDIDSGKSSKKIAYLTFDDGPYYNTYRVFDILDQYDVKATFFTTNTNGEYCFDNKSENCWIRYKEYLDRGHTIANHTYTHAIFRGLYNSVDSFMDAVIDQENLIKEQTGGYITNIVRFPGGSSTAKGLKDSIIERLRERGYGWVDWNGLDGDGGNLYSSDQAWGYFVNSINENFEVILYHDYNSITTNLLPSMIEYLQENGYVLLPLFYESKMVNK